SDPDATFPTPIIVACDSSLLTVDGSFVEFSLDQPLGEVIDGQHRIEGLQLAQASAARDITAFNLPVVFMLDLEPYEKAYVFSTINSKQTPVPRSLIYDLFELSETRSPYRTGHEIARTLNASSDSPFFRGLKMLGKRKAPTEYLTQGSFVTHLVKRISRKPQADEIAIKRGEPLSDNAELPFRFYWINNKDEVILKILENYFSSISEVFAEEWSPSTADNFILRKTVGFQALMEAFDEIWPESVEQKSASKEFFLSAARRFRDNLGGRPLTAAQFGSNAAAAGHLRKAFLGQVEAVS
ncbi:MAG TPA: DGQHR domain-containing protein, partial [Steroidobacteraceae bacterium]|nr:DGQHR domain-containing protein [Steroidobacteraceae bacterium]